MKYRSIIVLPFAKLDEVFAGLGNDITEQLKVKVAMVCCQLNIAFLLDHRISDDVVLQYS